MQSGLLLISFNINAERLISLYYFFFFWAGALVWRFASKGSCMIEDTRMPSWTIFVGLQFSDPSIMLPVLCVLWLTQRFNHTYVLHVHCLEEEQSKEDHCGSASSLSAQQLIPGGQERGDGFLTVTSIPLPTCSKRGCIFKQSGGSISERTLR